MRANQAKYWVFAGIILLSFFMHLPHLGKDLMSVHVWRQAQTETTIRNFYEEDMNILNPRTNNLNEGDRIFRMEFPLPQWLVACLYKIFGPHLVISRLFMWFTGLFSLFGIFFLVRELSEAERPGLIAMWALCFSPAFFYYTINPLPDNFSLATGIWGFFFVVHAEKNQKWAATILGGLFLGISALVKLPFILFFAVPGFLFLMDFIRKKINSRMLLVSLFPVLPAFWYVLAIPDWGGNGVVRGVFDNQIARDTFFDYVQHNLISTLPELILNFGAVPFFLIGLWMSFKKRKARMFAPFFLFGITLIAYFFFEINMIAKVHDYYLFPFIPPLFILVAAGAEFFWKWRHPWGMRITSVFLISLPLFCFLRMQGRWNPDSPNFNPDLLRFKKELSHSIPDDALIVCGNDESGWIDLYYLHKKGWTFHSDQLTDEMLKNRIKKGAQFLISDSRMVDENPEIKLSLDSLVLEKGTMRVYHLKEEQP